MRTSSPLMLPARNPEPQITKRQTLSSTRIRSTKMRVDELGDFGPDGDKWGVLAKRHGKQGVRG